MGFRKSIDGLTALVELEIKVAVFDPVFFVFLNKARNRYLDEITKADIISMHQKRRVSGAAPVSANRLLVVMR
ncbi:IS66 family insertion sequence element accessory protein TnpB [Pseudomonas putida]|uniref:IS66 family insertion sequence element accessory protein TnpB n=1 Tax=Pseudomonas TaxID=286 RepID=UPI000A3E94F2|nr:IS66 family insertion sequence element accessory protein TnpB [Pseudomonas sp. SG-MS2]